MTTEGKPTKGKPRPKRDNPTVQPLGDAFRAAIKDVMKERDISLRRLAKEGDVDDGMIARFLTGERTLTFATADRLAGVLGVRLERRRGRAVSSKARPARPAGGRLASGPDAEPDADA